MSEVPLHTLHPTYFPVVPPYRGTSFIRNRNPSGPYGMPMPTVGPNGGPREVGVSCERGTRVPP